MADDRAAWPARDEVADTEAPGSTTERQVEPAVAPLPAYPFAMGLVGGLCLGLAANMAVAVRSGSSQWAGAGGLMAGLAVAAGITIAAVLRAEVFAGSHEAPIAWLRGQVSIDRVALHLCAVWLGNLIGALAPVWLLIAGGQYAVLKYGIGEAAVNLAAAECSAPFVAVVLRAIAGGALMCLAFWLAAGADRPADKFLLVLLPALGIASGALPHLLVSSHIALLGLASDWVGAVAESPGNLSIGTFLGRCLAPATIGNAIGAAIALAGLHWVVHIRPRLAELARTTTGRRQRSLRPRNDGADAPPRELRRRPGRTRRTHSQARPPASEDEPPGSGGADS